MRKVLFLMIVVILAVCVFGDVFAAANPRDIIVWVRVGRSKAQLMHVEDNDTATTLTKKADYPALEYGRQTVIRLRLMDEDTGDSWTEAQINAMSSSWKFAIDDDVDSTSTNFLLEASDFEVEAHNTSYGELSCTVSAATSEFWEGSNTFSQKDGYGEWQFYKGSVIVFVVRVPWVICGSIIGTATDPPSAVTGGDTITLYSSDYSETYATLYMQTDNDLLVLDTGADTRDFKIENGGLQVDGAAELDGGITVDSTNFIVSGTTGDIQTAGDLTVTDTGSFTDDLFVDGGLKDSTSSVDVEDSLSVSGAATLSDNLTVNGDVTDLNSALDVSGTATFADTINVAGEAELDGGADITDTLTLRNSAAAVNNTFATLYLEADNDAIVLDTQVDTRDIQIKGGGIIGDGDLHLNPTAAGDIYAFGKTDIGYNVDGKSFYVYRMNTSQGDNYFRFFFNKYSVGTLTSSGQFQLTSEGSLFLNNVSGGLYLAQSANGDVFIFSDSTSGENRAFRIYGYNTETGDPRCAYWRLADSDDWFHLGRDSGETIPLGFSVDMPIQQGDDAGTVTLDSGVALEGTARVNRHFDIDAGSFFKHGTADPDAGDTGNFKTYLFDKGNTEILYYSQHVPYRWDTTANCTVTVRWAFDTPDAGKVVWELGYLSVGVGDVISAANTEIKQSSAGNHTAGTLLATTFTTTILAANLSTHDELGFYIARNGSDVTGDDTLNQDAHFISIHIYMVFDKLGEGL